MSVPVKYVSLDGRRLAYREAGSGPAMVFLHGLGGNSASWEPQFARFSATHRVVAWDMPGFGDSEPLATSSATTRDFSTLARRLMEALGIEHAVGVGTSYGTVILADLVQLHPSRITCMVFACGVIGMVHLPPEVRARLRETRRAELEAMGQRKFAETRNSTYLGKAIPKALVDRIVELAGSARPEGYLQAYGALTESDIFPSLAAVKVPVLVVSGADDPIAPARDCERVAKALSDAEYHCVENAGHYVNLEQAEAFNRLVDDFLVRIASERVQQNAL
ncbi:MAG: alpha/beta fold family hydrolase [Xanthobacteraceae bacterium]|jgi:pimeloyl-ACP methyl ester carboxylesterase|nr:alpha/beta fold family hydrolase [Xanthobacteraceae bacterium]